jgi:molybdenum cofactor synthesis domain-containing protein
MGLNLMIMTSHGSDLFSAAVLTISDKGSIGERVDTAGPAVSRILSDADFRITVENLIPDERELIVEFLLDQSDRAKVNLVVTTGGTGLSDRDITPQATEEVIDFRVLGMEEAMRSGSLSATPLSMLSRLVVGVRRNTLIINLPGSERGASENLSIVVPVLHHACAQLLGIDETDVH